MSYTSPTSTGNSYRGKSPRTPKYAGKHSPTGGRTTIRSLKANRDVHVADAFLIVKIIYIADPTEKDLAKEGEYVCEDFDIGDVPLTGGTPRLYSRRDVIFADHTGAVRGWYYVEPKYLQGTSVKLTAFGFRLHRICVTRKTRETFQINTPLDPSIEAQASSLIGTKAFPYGTIAQIHSAGDFVRISLKEVRVKQFLSKRTPEIAGEFKTVQDVLLADHTGEIRISLWNQASNLKIVDNMEITVHDVISKMNQYLDKMVMNANFDDQILIGQVHMKVIIGEIQGLDVSMHDIMILEVSLYENGEELVLFIDKTKMEDAINEGAKTIGQLQQMLPLHVKVTKATDGKVTNVVLM